MSLVSTAVSVLRQSVSARVNPARVEITHLRLTDWGCPRASIPYVLARDLVPCFFLIHARALLKESRGTRDTVSRSLIAHAIRFECTPRRCGLCSAAHSVCTACTHHGGRMHLVPRGTHCPPSASSRTSMVRLSVVTMTATSPHPSSCGNSAITRSHASLGISMPRSESSSSPGSTSAG